MQLDFCLKISIHAPRGGSDISDGIVGRETWVFQSTLPVGGATPKHQSMPMYPNHFNPRSPWGERLLPKISVTMPKNFNPRSPWGERPNVPDYLAVLTTISIHAPRGGSDTGVIKNLHLNSNFNPRSPWGERHFDNCRQSLDYDISIHAPRGGSDSHRGVYSA